MQEINEYLLYKTIITIMSNIEDRKGETKILDDQNIRQKGATFKKKQRYGVILDFVKHVC